MELTGKWSRSKKTITLTDSGTVSQDKDGGGLVSTTLQFGTSDIPSELSQKSVKIQPLQSGKDLTGWQNENDQKTVKQADAISNLDADCAVSATTVDDLQPNPQSK